MATTVSPTSSAARGCGATGKSLRVSEQRVSRERMRDSLHPQARASRLRFRHSTPISINSSFGASLTVPCPRFSLSRTGIRSQREGSCRSTTSERGPFGPPSALSRSPLKRRSGTTRWPRESVAPTRGLSVSDPSNKRTYGERRREPPQGEAVQSQQARGCARRARVLPQLVRTGG